MTAEPVIHEMYQPATVLGGAQLLACPCCGATPGLWQFRETAEGAYLNVVMCSTAERIGPQDGIKNQGCPLSMPSDDFYRPTQREAIKYWNDFAAALSWRRYTNSGPGWSELIDAVGLAPAWRPAYDVMAERQRQISVEGWTPEHDDGHVNDEIAAMACFYAMPPGAREWPATETGYGSTLGEAIVPNNWVAKQGDRRLELVKAGALILAEIERLDRAAVSTSQNGAT